LPPSPGGCRHEGVWVLFCQDGHSGHGSFPGEQRSPLMIDAVMIDSVQTTAEVLAITPLSEDNYRLRLHCPKLAARILPGQFFMLRSLGGNDPLLGRPFALYDTVLDAAGQPI